MIPKIIHQQAPRDKEMWHYKWFGSCESWQIKFWDHDYRLWDDETIDDFVKNNYPQYYEVFNSFPLKILKVDFTRPLLLHKYGGIYGDMDYICFHNFRDYIDETKVNIIESGVAHLPSWQEKVQNSLMASPPNYRFWLDFCDYSIEIYNKEEVREELEYSKEINWLEVEGWIVKATTGPIALTNFVKETNADINVLPRKFFNPRLRDTEKIDGNYQIKFDTDHPKDKLDKFQIDNLQGLHLTTSVWTE